MIAHQAVVTSKRRPGGGKRTIAHELDCMCDTGAAGATAASREAASTGRLPAPGQQGCRLARLADASTALTKAGKGGAAYA